MELPLDNKIEKLKQAISVVEITAAKLREKLEYGSKVSDASLEKFISSFRVIVSNIQMFK